MTCRPSQSVTSRPTIGTSFGSLGRRDPRLRMHASSATPVKTTELLSADRETCTSSFTATPTAGG